MNIKYSINNIDVLNGREFIVPFCYEQRDCRLQMKMSNRPQFPAGAACASLELQISGLEGETALQLQSVADELLLLLRLAVGSPLVFKGNAMQMNDAALAPATDGGRHGQMAAESACTWIQIDRFMEAATAVFPQRRVEWSNVLTWWCLTWESYSVDYNKKEYIPDARRFELGLKVLRTLLHMHEAEGDGFMKGIRTLFARAGAQLSLMDDTLLTNLCQWEGNVVEASLETHVVNLGEDKEQCWERVGRICLLLLLASLGYGGSFRVARTSSMRFCVEKEIPRWEKLRLF